MSGWNLPALIDHTVLRPDATKVEVLRLCEEAKANRFTVIFVPPCYIDEAVAAVAGASIRVGIPIGSPLGGHSTHTKVAEAIEAVADGVRVLDMVLNVSRLKSGDHDHVRNDIAEVVKATPNIEHKVILETCYLTQQEKRTACCLVVEAGADYVKTSTGFGVAGATVDDVRLLKETVAGRAKVKASGGIRVWKTTLAMLEEYHFVIIDFLAETISGTMAADDDALEALWVEPKDFKFFNLTSSLIQLFKRINLYK